MAFRFLRTLGERIAYPFVQTARIVGSALGDLGRALARAGTEIEVQALRRIAGALDEQDAASRIVLGQSSTEVLDPQGIPEALTRQRREYSWRFRMQGIDPRTGQRVERYLSISTDDLLSEAEARQRALSEFADEYGFSSEFIISMDTVSVTKAGRLGKL